MQSSEWLAPLPSLWGCSPEAQCLRALEMAKGPGDENCAHSISAP